MIDKTEDLQAEDPDELRREIREMGARVAYDALIAVCRDPKAPAPAKATAGTTILRVGGFLESVERKPEDELGKFSLKELERLRDDLQRQVAAADSKRGGCAQAASSGEDLLG